MAALLNDLLARTVQPRLVGHEGIPLHLHVDAPGASWGGWLAASGAMALALLIAEHGTGVLGECQARGCAHVLLRTGPRPGPQVLRQRLCESYPGSRLPGKPDRQALCGKPVTPRPAPAKSRPEPATPAPIRERHDDGIQSRPHNAASTSGEAT